VSIRRCREHNDVLVEEKELGTLWDDYGLVRDVVVNIFFAALFYYRSLPRTSTIGTVCINSLGFNKLHYVLLYVIAVHGTIDAGVGYHQPMSDLETPFSESNAGSMQPSLRYLNFWYNC
jgi:hypothetical protein